MKTTDLARFSPRLSAGAARARCTLTVLLSLTGCLWLTIAAARAAEPVLIRFAALPVIDALPVQLAVQQGAFAGAGIHVQIVPVASAAERDQVLQAGKADAVITDLVALALFRQAGKPLLAVRYSMKPAPGHPQFCLLAGGDSGTRAKDVAALKGRDVAISNGTVSEYVTVRLLEAGGLQATEVKLTGVPAIPARLSLLRGGKVGAATLPEPLASLAISQGALALGDDAQTPVPGSCAVFAFTPAFVKAHPESVGRFVGVIGVLSAAINRDPAASDVQTAVKRLVPAELAGKFAPPPFPPDAVPAAEQWQDVCRWLKAAGHLHREIPFAAVVSDRYLPRQR